MTGQNNNGLDLGKLLMAILVVAIHTKPLINLEIPFILRAYQNITQLAVPFFFVSTSYLFFIRKNDIYSSSCIEGLYKRINHFIRLYIIWEIIYFPCILYAYYHNEHNFVFNMADYARKFFFVGSNYYSSQLWFLLSMIYILIIFSFILKYKLGIKKILAFSVICYIIGAIINQYITTNTEIRLINLFLGYFVSLCNKSTVLIYILYISLGMVMAKHHVVLSKSKLVVCFCIGFLCEILLPGHPLLITLVKPFEVIAVFQFFMQLHLNDSPVYIKLRKSSTVLYYAHFWFIFLYELIFNVTAANGPLLFTICLLCCTLLAIIAMHLRERPRFRWIDIVFGW